MSTMTASETLQVQGKKAAAKFLNNQGYTVCEQDWCCKHGSVDLVVSDEGSLVFVEVKTRSNTDRGLPEDAITKDVRKRNERMAISYLTSHEEVDVAIRFDIITILVVSTDRAFLRHHINAFSLNE